MGRSSPAAAHGGRTAGAVGWCWAWKGSRGRSLWGDLHRRQLMGEAWLGRLVGAGLGRAVVRGSGVE